MEFTKLRLSGFKSFADSLELVIEPGLTGIVGPNGCGKSNLVEALRWVMGESSYKNMRASSMEEVIFSGSAKRHARLLAEVVLYLNNKEKKAPPAFNDKDELQISRRIEREVGSNYRVNGQDVRARDVQLLFADASTGARSPSMIGQGRVGELISAKPQARRALLEEAAGISGLYSRRHDAELRLNAAATNLEKVDDVIAGHESRLEGLKRQARQATRYRNIAGDIRALEALILHLAWAETTQSVEECNQGLSKAYEKMGAAQLEYTQKNSQFNARAEELPPLRDSEVQATARLQHSKITISQLDEEETRIKTRIEELESLQKQLLEDKQREQDSIANTQDIIEKLENEKNKLQVETNEIPNRDDSKIELNEIISRVNEGEAKLEKLTQELASGRAHKSHLQEAATQAQSRRQELLQQEKQCQQEIETLSNRMQQEFNREAKNNEVENLQQTIKTARLQLKSLEENLQSLLEREYNETQTLSKAQASFEKTEVQIQLLQKMLNINSQHPPIANSLQVESGYETALAAALGDDLQASDNIQAGVHWRHIEGAGDPELPANIVALASKVQAPPLLQRRLAQIGLCEGGEGDELQKQLKAGQRLVSPNGELWRWDGFKAKHSATNSAKRLEQKNNLQTLEKSYQQAKENLTRHEQTLEQTKGQVQSTRQTLQNINDTIFNNNEQLEKAGRELIELEREYNEVSSRHAALLQTKQHIAESLREIIQQIESESTSGENTQSHAELETQVRELTQQLSVERQQQIKMQARHGTLEREASLKQDRLSAMQTDMQTWQERLENSKAQIAVLDERIENSSEQIKQAQQTSGGFDERRQKLLDEMSRAQNLQSEAAENLAKKEAEHKQAEKESQDTLAVLQEMRETHIRAQERLDAAKLRQSELETRIQTELECEPQKAIELAGYKVGAEIESLPERERSEKKLEKLKSERERLGAVNLQAEDEYDEIAKQRDELMNEREDLLQAISRLRKAILSLNREGRARLLSAFDKVNQKFQDLFRHLFGGGEARLELVESDDPLEAGLEILACPPGKKLQTMTLLSGGEQALTALALIFAVFLTNPAPICVLDEVDAPLDDHNVERFCRLMENMSKTTNTRFIIITHNPITMARMDRLFGVTMAEKGISQLVSVDLQTAESYREVG